MNEVVIGGIYRHFKGGLYKVLNMGRCSETEAEMVIYMKLYGDYSVWVRPLDMFVGTKAVDGVDVKRFEHVTP